MTNMFEFETVTEAEKTGKPFTHVVDHAADMDYIFSIPLGTYFDDVAAEVADGYCFRVLGAVRLTIWICEPGELAVSEDRYLLPTNGGVRIRSAAR